MNNQEAIKLLGNLFLVVEVLKVDKEKRKEIKTALDMAIKALSESTGDTKTGEWIIEKRDSQDVYEHAYCSECDSYWSNSTLVDSFNYCPKCGARMKGVIE